MQTREEQIEIFKKNQTICEIENSMYSKFKTDYNKMEEIFYKILENVSGPKVYVTDKPILNFNGKVSKVVTRLTKDLNDIVEHFSKLKTIFIYNICETDHPSMGRSIIIRYYGE